MVIGKGKITVPSLINEHVACVNPPTLTHTPVSFLLYLTKQVTFGFFVWFFWGFFG